MLNHNKKVCWLLLLLLLFILPGCNKSESKPANPLLGKWNLVTGQIPGLGPLMPGGGLVLEFLQDGTIIYQGMSGKYRILDKERFELDAGEGVKVIYNFTLSNNKLTISVASSLVGAGNGELEKI